MLVAVSILLAMSIALTAMSIAIGISATVLPDVPRRVDCTGLLRRYFAYPILLVMLTALAVFAVGPGPPSQVPAGSSKVSSTSVSSMNGAAIVSMPVSTSS